jgi:endonuclease G
MSAERQQRLRGLMQDLMREGVSELEGNLEGAPTQTEAWIARARGTEQEKDRARSAVRKVARQEPLELPEMDALEAIILPEGRPVLDITNDAFATALSPWEHLNVAATRQRIEAAIPSVGRLEVPEHPQLPYAGTGFIVGDGLMMTNRHVAQLFTEGLGDRGLAFRAGLEQVQVDFRREIVPSPPTPLRITEVLMIHPFWDMALLRVEGLGQRKALRLAAIDPGDLDGRDVAVIGYPAFDFRNDFELQNRIFRGVFQIKRLQPGKLKGRRETVSFGNQVLAMTHDSSTLGGNSGSAVIDVATGHVLGLHFGGAYRITNYGVPAFELKRDPRVRDAGVDFTDDVVPTDVPWDGVWAGLESQAASSGDGALPAPSAGVPTPAPAAPVTTAVLNIPLQITISVSAPGLAAGTGLTAPAISPAPIDTETTAIDPNWTGRPGYDPLFLDPGVAKNRVPLPVLSKTQEQQSVEVPTKYRKSSKERFLLNYHHYAVAFNKARRQAWFSAAMIDGDRRFKFDRGKDRWFIDPRIDDPKKPRFQMGEELYAEANTDRGHLTRYLDVAWGDAKSDAIRATNDTFHFTNCSLQLSGFNQGKDRWQGLEQFLLENKARKEKRRMVVMTGPIFKKADPVYRNKHMDYSIRVPLSFWKVCTLVRPDGTLAATAFVLGQPDIAQLPGFEERFDVGAAQITVADLEKRTGLDFGSLKDHDPFSANGIPGTLEAMVGDETQKVKPLMDPTEIII